MKTGKRGTFVPLSKKTSGELKAFWDTLLSISWTWPPPWDPGSPIPVKLPLDREVLCWWCRTVHLASEVEQCMALPMRKAGANGTSSSTSNVAIGKLLAQYLETWAFLTSRTYPDGSKRLTGRLSLSCGSGGIILSATDDQTGLYCSLTGSTVDDLLLAFEAGLAAGDLPWRDSKYAKGRK